MITKIQLTLNRFSPKFWVLVGSAFIDSIGGTMMFPFLTLYITQKFDVGMTQAGQILGLFSLFGFFGGMIGGALADRFGRKGIVLFGLVFSALSSLAFAVIKEFSVFYILAVFVGLLSDIAGPAYQAMVADLLPEELRADGFGILRVARNLSWVIGPTVGGILIAHSYVYVFVGDAITSVIVALIFWRLMPETKPEAKIDEPHETLAETFIGYFQVAKDKLFLAYVIAVVFNLLGYQQVYSSLSVFLRDVHSVTERGFGMLMSINASVVVLFQFLVTSIVSKYKPMRMLALGSLLYMIGLSMYGYVSVYALFVFAMLIITVGEMIIMPVSQAMTAKFAPEQMRGRYMAFFGIAWLFPATIGPTSAGLILDNLNPNLLWYLCGVSCFIAVILFLSLNKRVEQSPLRQRVEA